MSINDQIEIIIDDKLNKLPYPVKCRITKVYTGNEYVDVETENGEVLTYILAIGNNKIVGKTGVILYLNGGFTDCIILT